MLITELQIAQDCLNESCGSCGADIGPSIQFPWHIENEDCRAIRQPIDSARLFEHLEGKRA